jgi:hypothetical protein
MSQLFEQIYKKTNLILYHIGEFEIKTFESNYGECDHAPVDNVVFFSRNKLMCLKYAKSILLEEDEDLSKFYLHYCKPTRELNILNPASKKDYKFLEKLGINEYILSKVAITHNWMEMEEDIVSVYPIIRKYYDGFVTAEYDFSNIGIFRAHKNIKILKTEKIPVTALHNIEYEDECILTRFRTKVTENIKDFNIILKESKKKLIQAKFIRIGNIDSYKLQKRWEGSTPKDKMTTHVAPAKRGFYASPLQFQEPFLLSSLENSQPELFKKQPIKPHEDASEEEWKQYWDAMEPLDAIRKDVINRNKKVFTLKDSDIIWHHLNDYLKRVDIIKQNNDWCLTTIKDWKKAVGRCLETDIHYYGKDPYSKLTAHNFTKDHYEIFVPKETHV